MRRSARRPESVAGAEGIALRLDPGQPSDERARTAQAEAGQSSAANPTVRFGTPGVKTVTLTVCSAGGCSSVTRQLTVLEPGPVITTFSVAPRRVEIGATVLLEASASGQPSLAFSWLVLRAGALQQVLSGAAAAWSTAGWGSGIYTVRLIVSNASGSAEADQDVLLVPETASHFFHRQRLPADRYADRSPAARGRGGA
jgi:hypothetical protein